MNAVQPTEAVKGPERDQAALWNGAAGRSWVEAEALVDRLFEPIERVLVDAASARGARSVLDVGCGTGATTVALARAVDRCTGVDVSEPMTAAARARAERAGVDARFVRADAQTHAFEPASFDFIVSRFGVMFFDDPVRAFANLRRAARVGAGLGLVVWRGAEDNPFMTAAERAAAPLLPNLPARRPDEPGQFGFANPARVRDVLERGGWVDVDIAPLDVSCAFPRAELDTYLTRFGPVGRALATADDATRRRVLEAVRPAFEPYLSGDEVRFEAACWMIGARARAPR